MILRFLYKTLVSFALCLLYAPLLAVVLQSFNLHKKLRDFEFTIVWYEKLLNNQILQDALYQSISVAFASSVIATAIGTIGAYALERSDFKGKPVVDFLTFAPLVLPEMVLGLSLLIWFTFLHVTLGWFSMTIAHVTFGVSYVVMVVRTRLKDYDSSLEEAARDLGANKYQVFFKINLPINVPGILAGFMMTFILSFDDFIIAFFTTGVGSDTLPLKLYSLIKLSFDPQIYALSALILSMTLVCVVVFSRAAKGTRLIVS